MTYDPKNWKESTTIQYKKVYKGRSPSGEYPIHNKRDFFRKITDILPTAWRLRSALAFGLSLRQRRSAPEGLPFDQSSFAERPRKGGRLVQRPKPQSGIFIQELNNVKVDISPAGL